MTVTPLSVYLDISIQSSMPGNNPQERRNTCNTNREAEEANAMLERSCALNGIIVSRIAKCKAVIFSSDKKPFFIIISDTKSFGEGKL